MDDTATYLACLTPPGRAAIATLAVCGPRAWEIMRTLFCPGRSGTCSLPETSPVGRYWFGRLGAELRDEVVLAVKEGSHSPWLEIHCHGGPEVVRLLSETFSRQGVRLCSWEELETRGKLPDRQQRVLPDLVAAPTARTAGILLAQFHGAFDRSVAAIAALLQEGEVAKATERLERLVQLAALGDHLVQPWRVIVAGAPNVGKSSLVNALAGYTRCLVSATPGTTRDVVSVLLAIDGWPVELTDTAGLRHSNEALETAGIARAREALATADLRLWILDGANAPIFPEPDDVPWLFVINKVDLAPAWDWSTVRSAIQVSARTRAGLDELCQALSSALVPSPPERDEAVPLPSACEMIRIAAALMRAGETAAAQIMLAAYAGA